MSHQGILLLATGGGDRARKRLCNPGADRSCNKGKSTWWGPSLPSEASMPCAASPRPAPRAAPSIPSPRKPTSEVHTWFSRTAQAHNTPTTCQARAQAMEISRQRCNFCPLRILAVPGSERRPLVSREESEPGIIHSDSSLVLVNLGQTTVSVSSGCRNKYY